MFVTAIIAAGGRGLRVGNTGPKQLLIVGGRPILERSVSIFLNHPGVREVIVALPDDLAAAPPEYLRQTVKPLKIVAGGPRRQDSVVNAFRQVDERTDVVVVHDAARPFASADLIDRTIAAAVQSGAALAAVQARDTVKLADTEGPPGGGRHVLRTLPRESIFLAQTPQAFRRDVLQAALASTADATDEAALAERAGHSVRLVDGEVSNIKITTAGDLVLAEAIASTFSAPASAPSTSASSASSASSSFRIGTGYDLHRLVAGRPLVIGGVTIAFDRGAIGHSDADVVCHAVTDAVLGAAGLGDIGSHFPDSDPRWKGASSLDLLARAVALVREHGFQIANADVTVILEQPKIRPYIDAMREAVAVALGADPACVSIKAKTNEGVDAVGRGDAIAAHAVALLVIRN